MYAPIKFKRIRELAACPGTQIYELSDNRLRRFHKLYLTGDNDLEYMYILRMRARERVCVCVWVRVCVCMSKRFNNIKYCSFFY